MDGGEADVSTQSRLAVGELIAWASDEEGAVLLDLPSGEYTALSPHGTRVWELLAELNSVAAVLNVLAAEYDAPRERIEEDVLVLLRQLVGTGHLRVLAPGEDPPSLEQFEPSVEEPSA